MDFTPGAMINMQPECYSAERPNNAGVGDKGKSVVDVCYFRKRIANVGR